MSIKKFFAGSLAALMIFGAAGTLFSPAPAKAQTLDALQAQVAALLAQIAALQGGSSSSCAYTFTTDLTIGSTGEAVRQLQMFLNSKGYTVAASGAGSAGMESTYFGVLSQSALAKYQAANAISPAAGYFGPITRAKVNAECTTGGGSTPGTGTGTTLNGGEARLSSFKFIQEEDEIGEGEELQVGTIEFDVKDGDVRVERVELSFNDAASSSQPWRFVESITVGNGTVDADSRNDWDKVGNDYSIVVTGVNTIVKAGNKADIAVEIEALSTIRDLGVTFDIVVTDDGVRAIDAAGIQQYIGTDADEIDVEFVAQKSGKLSLKTNSSNPDALTINSQNDDDETLVFVFDIENGEDADAVITDVIITGTGNLANTFRRAFLNGERADSITTSSMVFNDIDIDIDGDDRETFELEVIPFENATGTVKFSVSTADITAEGADSGELSNWTSGTKDSETHTVAPYGFSLENIKWTTTSGTGIGQIVFEFKVEVDGDSDTVAINAAEIIDTLTGGSAATGTTPMTDDDGSLTKIAGIASSTVGGFDVESGDSATFRVTYVFNAVGSYEVQITSVAGLGIAEDKQLSGTVLVGS